MLDIPGVRALEPALIAATSSKGRPLIVDLSDVSFISSSGLGVLVKIARALAIEGHSSVLVGATPVIENVIRTAKLDTVLRLAHSIDVARDFVLLPPVKSE